MGKRNTKSGNTLTYETLPELFTGICDAIRAKDGTSADINHQDIPSKIGAIPAGAEVVTSDYNGNVAFSTFWENRTYTAAKAEKVYMIAVAIASDTVTTPLQPKKNGSNLTPTKGVIGSGRCVGFFELQLAQGDVITFGGFSAGAYQNNLYVLLK